MNFIKRIHRPNPELSLVLLDWSVRESFHLLHYLRNQTVERDRFEVIVIEYYSRVSDAIRRFEDQVDVWLVLGMPEDCYYHKHLMYNAGIVVSRGEIVMIGDSDAMVKETFIDAIIENFARDPKIVYHIDQFRNMRRDFYPFNYPSFEEVLGEGCINGTNGKTSGVLDAEDPLHSRNYGACMCARREELIAIGGADIHIDYLGHICGPYDMTFRLVNHGNREVWEENEFMYHTWHPGQAGADNYLGPHDGRHMSTTALEALVSGRVRPLLENESIRLLRTGEAKSVDGVLDKLIDPRFYGEWNVEFVEKNASHGRWRDYKVPLELYKGYRLVSELGYVLAYPIGDHETAEPAEQRDKAPFEGADIEEAKRRIDAATPFGLATAARVAHLYVLAIRALCSLYNRSQRLPGRFPPGLKMAFGGILALPALLVLLLLVPHRLLRRLSRASRVCRNRSGALDNLAVTLHNLDRWGSLRGEQGLPVVLADNGQTVYYLRILSALGLLPEVETRRVRDLANVEACLKELDRQDWRGLLVIPGDLYTRFRSTVTSAEATKRLLVV